MGMAGTLVSHAFASSLRGWMGRWGPLQYLWDKYHSPSIDSSAYNKSASRKDVGSWVMGVKKIFRMPLSAGDRPTSPRSQRYAGPGRAWRAGNGWQDTQGYAGLRRADLGSLTQFWPVEPKR